MTVTVEIPMTLPSVANLRLHWAHKARMVKAQRKAVAFVLRAKRPDASLSHPVSWRLGWPHSPLAVTLTRIAPRALDSDNLASAFKAVRDEVAAYFGVNDNDPRIVWRYAQVKSTGAKLVRIDFEVHANATQAAASLAWDALMNEPRRAR